MPFARRPIELDGAVLVVDGTAAVTDAVVLFDVDSDGFGIDASFFDERVHLSDADSSSADVGLVHQIMGDASRVPFGHITSNWLLSQKNSPLNP